MNRRHFLQKTSLGLGMFALGALFNPTSLFSKERSTDNLKTETPHHIPKAKRIIFLFQSGGPSQHDLFDYKPFLNRRDGDELPDSVRGGQRLTGMSSFQNSFPLVGSRWPLTSMERAVQTVITYWELCFCVENTYSLIVYNGTLAEKFNLIKDRIDRLIDYQFVSIIY